MGKEKTANLQNVFTENDFRNFVNRFEWTFAKTYAATAPHEYIVPRKVGLEYKLDFISAARFIRDAGFTARKQDHTLK